MVQKFTCENKCSVLRVHFGTKKTENGSEKTKRDETDGNFDQKFASNINYFN